MRAEKGSGIYVNAHGEAQRIARALGMTEKAREHEGALERVGEIYDWQGGN
jgi:hypothetical protein